MRNLRRMVGSLVWAAALGIPLMFGADAGAQTLNENSLKGMKWREIGPFRGGRVLAVAGVAGDPNTYYFGAVAGGVWKTTDAGLTWAPLTDQTSIMSVGAIAVAPSDANVIYAGTGESCIRGNISYGDGMYKSVDAGDSYHIDSVGLRPDPPPGGGDTDVVTDDQGFAYFVDLEALVNLGVAVSNDGGNSWRKSPVTVQSTGDDRQWFAVDNGLTASASDNTIFLTFRQVLSSVRVFSSPGSTGPTDPVGGLVYFITSNFAVDARAGVGLNGHSNDFVAGAGFAVRF